MIGISGRRLRGWDRPSRIFTLGLVGLASICFPAGWARAQYRPTEFSREPILVLDNGGHHAPVRRLVFTGDEEKKTLKLLSAGDDKVVRVWEDLTDEPKLTQTIRPPIWRGRAGAINGMALTNNVEPGSQTLALGGYGVDAMRGEIGLYHFPGAADHPFGDIEVYLEPGDRSETNDEAALLASKGHMAIVTCLAFSPDGKTLASASNDSTVRLWDYKNKNRKPPVILRQAGPGGPINALAFTPDGRKLVAGGSDGVLRVWDVLAQPPRLVQSARPLSPPGFEADVSGKAINTLGVSLDGRWVVIGREDGFLFRYDLAAPNLEASPVRIITGANQSAVEGLAFGPDGLLATAIIKERKSAPGDKPSVACDIEIRNVNLPNQAATLIETTTNLVYALAFSPKGKFLAYSGGDRQQVSLVDLQARPDQPKVISSGATKGRSVWRVGFSANLPLKLAYSGSQPNEPDPSVYNGFDLKDRERVGVNPGDFRGGSQEFQGWSVRPIGTYQLMVSRGAESFPIDFNPNLDGRWWDYKFLPPGPKHPRLALAIACERGVAIYRLDDHVRTRFLDGHTGAVYCVAPSPDGKWLATGGSDQTVRLWPLAGIDELAPLGAVFAVEAGRLTVKTVEKESFADLGGMLAGDVVFGLPVLEGKKVADNQAFLARYGSAMPNSTIQYEVERQKPGGGMERLPVSTSKRDRPVLSLFVGLDGEWVLWSPRGYYDSTPNGDLKFLFWQVNRYEKGQGPPKGPDLFPIVTQFRELRSPKILPGNKIDRLLELADERVAFQNDPDPAPRVLIPPVVTPLLGAGGALVKGPDGRPVAPDSPLPDFFTVGPGPLILNWKVEPMDQGDPPGSFEVRLGGRLVQQLNPPPFDAVKRVSTIQVRYELTEPGSTTFTALVNAGTSLSRRVALNATIEGEPAKKPNRLNFLAIAPTFEDPRIASIAKNVQDVRKLGPFFGRYLVNDTGGPFLTMNRVGPILEGKGASSPNVVEAFEKLRETPIEPGDMAVVVIETYILNYGQKTTGKPLNIDSRLVVSDSQGSPPLKNSTLSTEDLSYALKTMVDRGGRVVVVLDASHPTVASDPKKAPWGIDSDACELAKILRDRCGATVVVASRRRATSAFAINDHRPLAQAILESIQAENLRKPNDPMMTLKDFQDRIIQEVTRLTSSFNDAAVYRPDTIPLNRPLLNRKP